MFLFSPPAPTTLLPSVPSSECSGPCDGGGGGTPRVQPGKEALPLQPACRMNRREAGAAASQEEWGPRHSQGDQPGLPQPRSRRLLLCPGPESHSSPTHPGDGPAPTEAGESSYLIWSCVRGPRLLPSDLQHASVSNHAGWWAQLTAQTLIASLGGSEGQRAAGRLAGRHLPESLFSGPHLSSKRSKAHPEA